MKKTILALIFTFCVSAAFSACSSASQDSSNGTTVETTVEQKEAPTEKVISFDEARNNCMEKYKDTDYYYVFKNSFEISPDSSSPTMSYKGSKYDSSSVNSVDYMNQELGFSYALFKKMKMTRAIDGTQTDENEHFKVTWTYHPKNGLNVIYEKK